MTNVQGFFFMGISMLIIGFFINKYIDWLEKHHSDEKD